MQKMRNIIDTWSVLEQYGVTEYQIVRDVVVIPASEYERLLASVVSQKYIKNLAIY